MLDTVLYVIGVITVTILSFFFLKKPLEEKNIEGALSIVARLVIGVFGGLLVGFFLTM